MANFEHKRPVTLLAFVFGGWWWHVKNKWRLRWREWWQLHPRGIQ